MSHSCSAIVVSCIDFRFQRTVEEWARGEIGAGNYDRVAWAGGALQLDLILGQIDISVRLHQITRVVLMNHEECGAYGPEGTPERHAKDLRVARAAVLARYPDLTVELYCLQLDGTAERVD